jgi:hypothetical protein
MVNVAVLVAVLTVAVLAPSTTFAATQTVRTTQITSHTGISLLDMILQMVGFNPVSGSRPTPVQAPSQGSLGTGLGGQISTDEAIWGGGKCGLRC